MRSSLPYLAIFAVVAVASCFAAEALFRLSGDHPSDDLRGLFTPSDNGGYRLAESVDTSAHWSAGYFTAHTDELGLRCDGQRHLARRSGESIEALIVGDSQGFGNGVNFEESLAGATAVMAADAGTKVSNLSVGGHALGNQLSLARALTARRDVDVANYVFLFTPVLASNPDGFARQFVGADGRLYSGPPERGTATLAWLKSNLAVYSRIRDAVRNVGIGSRPEDAGSHVLQLYTAGQDDQALVERLAAAVERFQTVRRGKAAQVHLVYVPLTVEFEKTALEAQAALRGVTLDLNRPFRICQAVANRLDSPILDLRPVLRQFHAEGKPLNLRADFHYNADLSKACALSLWTWLEPRLRDATHPLSTATNHAR